MTAELDTKTFEALKNFLEYLPNFYNKKSGSNNYQFLYSISKSYADLKLQIDNLVDAIHIDTAVDGDLEKIGALFQLTRRNLESDATFRSRIKGYWQGITGSGVGISIKSLVANILNLELSDISIEEETLIFDILINIAENTNFDSLNYIRDEVNKGKALGTYLRDIIINTKNNVFLINTSNTNGQNNI